VLNTNRRFPRAKPDTIHSGGSDRVNSRFYGFFTLGLSDKVIAAVSAAGYTTPTPIQQQAIPHVLARRDVLGIAQTGTGKTAAFVLPMLTMLEKGRARARMPRTLILEPTRELAAQVEDSFDKYGINHKLNVALLIGGVSFDDQDTKLTRGVDVLIATPGRLLDHFERGRLLLSGVELLVIDEAIACSTWDSFPISSVLQTRSFAPDAVLHRDHADGNRRITEQFLHNPVKVSVAAGNNGYQLPSNSSRPGAVARKRDTCADSFGRRKIPRTRSSAIGRLSRAASPLARAPWIQCCGTARRPGSVGAHGGTGSIPQGRREAADCFRCCGARA
jgi:hypothetical protein